MPRLSPPQSMSSYYGAHDPFEIVIPSSKMRNIGLLADLEYATAPGGEPCYNVVVAKPVRLAPCSHTPFIMTSSWSGFLFITSKLYRERRTNLQVVRWLVDVISGQTFYVLLTNMSEKLVHIIKHLIIAQKVDKPREIVQTKVNFFDFESDT